jgi:2-keto-4-pentenoate hydratase/2-oxohepta-3-ene-1,7-dioic acid hydratase in catechol pathway
MHLVTFGRLESAAGNDIDSEHHSIGDTALGLDSLESGPRGARRLGATIQLGPHAGEIVDLNRALAIKLAYDDAGAPEAEADSLLPADVLSYLRRLPAARRAAEDALGFVMDALERYDAPDVLRAGVVLPRRSVRLWAPVPRPGKIVGVARNYARHAAERGDAGPPEEPVLFLKAPSAVIGPDEEILLPSASQRVDYEGELAVVIGRRTRCVDRAEALACVAGYCVANDVTARDYQNERGQRFIGKSCDTFAPLGPALVTPDEVPDPQSLSLRTSLSGELVQSGTTKEMVFPVADIIAFVSRLMTLEPGDVLLTGTPEGVGAARQPPRFLRDGDVVEVEIERLGRLRNHARQERS